MGKSEFSCRFCGEIRRTFWSQGALDRHVEMRHGKVGKYLTIEKPPQRPSEDGSGFEQFFAAQMWDRDLLLDRAEECETQARDIDDLLDALREAGKLDCSGKAKNGKATRQRGNKAKGVGATGAAKKVQGTKKATKRRTVGGEETRPPDPRGGPPKAKAWNGGIAPPGRPFWDTKHSRWTKEKPADHPTNRSRSASKAARKPISKTELRYEAADEAPAEAEGD